MLLRAVAKRPAEYGLDYRHASLTNIVEFAVDNPAFCRRCRNKRRTEDQALPGARTAGEIGGRADRAPDPRANCSK